jgi:hypothetical protein
MSEQATEARKPREVVGLVSDRPSFDRIVAALFAAGFERSDVSVLASHESLDAAEQTEPTWREVMAALVGEARYEAPLVASGAIALAGGPVFAAVAGVIGAAVGGLAIREVLEEVTAKAHTDDFARSLAAGSVILWVRVDSQQREATATRVLNEGGAANVHILYPSPAIP